MKIRAVALRCSFIRTAEHLFQEVRDTGCGILTDFLLFKGDHMKEPVKGFFSYITIQIKPLERANKGEGIGVEM